MNYTELQQAIIEDTHRPDLAALVPRFIRLGEGLIRRDLRAYELSVQLSVADQIAPGKYTLPEGVVDIRTVKITGDSGDGLTRVAPNAINRLNNWATPIQYAQFGQGSIEIAGHPSDTNTIDVVYFGIPAPLEDVPTNSLLDDHEGLYQSAAQYYLYLNTQDRELAQDQANTFDAIMERLNEQMARKVGGSNIAPTYNFTTRSSY